MSFKKLNLHKKAVITVGAILLFVIIMNTSILTFIAYNKYKQAMLSKTIVIAETMQRELNKVLSFDVPLNSLTSYVEKLNEHIAHNEAIGYAMIMDPSDRILFHSDEWGGGREHKVNGGHDRLNDGDMLIEENELFYDIFLPLNNSAGELIGILHMGLKTEVIKSQLYTLIIWAVGISLLCILLSVPLIYYFIFKVITKPINTLENAAEQIAYGDFNNVIKVESSDEIGQLANAFNVMTENLKVSTVKRVELTKEIDERKLVEKQLKQLAFYDQLTNLANRALFTRQLKYAIKRAERLENYKFAVLFMDLDRFKIINDSLGHSMGDQLLIEVARRLKKCVRSVDMVARFGGDEFAILLDGVKDISDALRVADRIQRALLSPFELLEHEVCTSVCIGIVESVSNYSREEDVLRDADIAMYRAKEKGKAEYKIFDSEMHNSAIKLLKMEADLRRAVENGELLVYYQPIISLTDGNIVGAEALVRWQRPEFGLILPHGFITLAEDSGLILSIGEWMLRMACAQNKAWQDEGYQHLFVGVNISSRQFQHQDLPSLIKSILRETGLDPRHFNAEITESIAMEENSIKILNKLSELGIQISIDDFGTGYSSLGSLKSFPINTLKIDKSFIRDIAKNPNVEEIIKAIIGMAQNLKMQVVSEGVETEEQLEFLRGLGCEKVQGYFFSHPVPADEFVKLLKKNERAPRLVYKKKKII